MKYYQRISFTILLCLANILNYTDRVYLQTIITDIKNYFSIENTQAGLFNTVYQIFYIASSLIYGALGDFTSRKILIIFGIILWNLAEISGSFAPNNMIGLFYLSRMLFGIGQSGLSHLGVVIIGDLFTDSKRTKCISFYLAAIPFGSGLGFILAKQIASATGDWKWVFRITPIIGLFLALMIAIFTKEPSRGFSESSTDENNVPEHFDIENEKEIKPKITGNDIDNQKSVFIIVKETFKYLAIKKSFMLNTVAFTLITSTLGSLAFWMPNYLELLHDNFKNIPGYTREKNKMGYIFGIIVVLAGFSGVIFPSIMIAKFRTFRRPIELYICLFSSFLGSFGMLLTLFMSIYNQYLMWISMFFMIFFFSCFWLPQSVMMINLIMPVYRARATAFEGFCIHTFGDALCPFIIGVMADRLIQGNSSFSKFYSMFYSLFICPILAIIAGVFYCISLKYYIKDTEFTRNEVEIKNIQSFEVE